MKKAIFALLASAAMTMTVNPTSAYVKHGLLHHLKYNSYRCNTNETGICYRSVDPNDTKENVGDKILTIYPDGTMATGTITSIQKMNEVDSDGTEHTIKRVWYTNDQTGDVYHIDTELD